MRTRRTALAALPVAAALTLTACASTGTAATGAQQSAYGVDTAGEGPTASVATDTPTAPAAAPSAEPSAEASSGPCVTHACIAQELDQSLVGGVAADDSVATKVVCNKHTVVYHRAADTYSASCTITYSDGSTAYGTGNLLEQQQKVTFSVGG